MATKQDVLAFASLLKDEAHEAGAEVGWKQTVRLGRDFGLTFDEIREARDVNRSGAEVQS